MIKGTTSSQIWWYIPLLLGKVRQENCEFQVNHIARPYLKKRKRKGTIEKENQGFSWVW